MPNISDSILQLSKDIGKVSERTARLETNSETIKSQLTTFLKKQSMRDEQNAHQMEERAIRDRHIDDHIRQVCQFANFSKFVLKYIFPPGAIIAITGGLVRYFGII